MHAPSVPCVRVAYLRLVAAVAAVAPSPPAQFVPRVRSWRSWCLSSVHRAVAAVAVAPAHQVSSLQENMWSSGHSPTRGKAASSAVFSFTPEESRATPPARGRTPFS